MEIGSANLSLANGLEARSRGAEARLTLSRAARPPGRLKPSQIDSV